MKALKLGIYTKHINQFEKLSSSVNHVWNYHAKIKNSRLNAIHQFTSKLVKQNAFWLW